MSKVLLSVVILVLVLAVVVGVTISNQRSTERWLSVDGKITRSELRTRQVKRRQIYQAELRTAYDLGLDYEYWVNGVRRTGHAIQATIPNRFVVEAEAKEMARRFARGTSVAVYYDPADPDQSCLVSSAGIPLRGYLVIGLVGIFVVGLAVAAILVVSGRIDLGNLLVNLRKRN